MGKPRTAFTVMPLKNTCDRGRHYHRGLTAPLQGHSEGGGAGGAGGDARSGPSQAGPCRAQRTCAGKGCLGGPAMPCPDPGHVGWHFSCQAWPTCTVTKLLSPMNTTSPCLIAALSCEHTYTHMHTHACAHMIFRNLEVRTLPSSLQWWTEHQPQPIQ